jgi:hypothetical protein
MVLSGAMGDCMLDQSKLSNPAKLSTAKTRDFVKINGINMLGDYVLINA